jgi:hypothetical protein
LKIAASLLFGLAPEPPSESMNSGARWLLERRLKPLSRARGATPIPPTLLRAAAMRPATLVPWSPVVATVLVGSVDPFRKFRAVRNDVRGEVLV